VRGNVRPQVIGDRTVGREMEFKPMGLANLPRHVQSRTNWIWFVCAMVWESRHSKNIQIKGMVCEETLKPLYEFGWSE